MPFSLNQQYYKLRKDFIIMKQVETKRLIFLDAAKGIGILAVMFGHITSIGNPIDRWISTFKLPIFFVISGYLLCRSKEMSTTSPCAFIKKKAKVLLIPYFLFSLLTIIYRTGFAVFKGKWLIYYNFASRPESFMVLDGIIFGRDSFLLRNPFSSDW